MHLSTANQSIRVELYHQGERAGCLTRHSDILITDPHQRPQHWVGEMWLIQMADGGPWGSLPLPKLWLSGFTGAQAVSSSTSPLHPLSRKPHPSPGLQTGSLCLCLVSNPILKNQVHTGQPHFGPSQASHTYNVQGGFDDLSAHPWLSFSPSHNSKGDHPVAPGRNLQVILGISLSSLHVSHTWSKSYRCYFQNPSTSLSVSMGST